ncbi:Cilia- and flagella-associated protein 58 [Eumeta japonica]|uniref:Cilia-and flagella-associated protein 58 n=1 Tax=Eumeta variegata TaxID=151549 RepID=A0A4C1SCV9_EUMVA|nr:Cilia- and flagella-associated protein 58 [Eumeta japonica]
MVLQRALETCSQERDNFRLLQTVSQTQYNQRIEDIRLFKVEIANLQTERECLSRAIRSTANMRTEIISLQRLLNQERVRVRSLIEDAKISTDVLLKQEIEKANLQRQLEDSNKVTETLKRVIENLPSTNVKQNWWKHSPSDDTTQKTEEDLLNSTQREDGEKL